MRIVMVQVRYSLLWIKGPSLPHGILVPAMAESPDGKGVLLFGGRDSTFFYEDRILEMRAETNSWNTLNIILQNRRAGHVVIPLQ